MFTWLRYLAVFVAAVLLSGCIDVRGTQADGSRYYLVHIDESLVAALHVGQEGTDLVGLFSDGGGTANLGSNSGFCGGTGGIGGDPRGLIGVVLVVMVVVIVVLLFEAVASLCSRSSSPSITSNEYDLELEAGDVPMQRVHVRNGRWAWVTATISQAIDAGAFSSMHLRHASDGPSLPVILTLNGDAIGVHVRPVPGDRIAPLSPQ